MNRLFNKKHLCLVLMFLVSLVMFLNHDTGVEASSIDAFAPKRGVELSIKAQQITPESSHPLLPEGERTRYATVAEIFTHPETRAEIVDENLTAEMLTNHPMDYDGFHVHQAGKVVSIQQVENLLPDDWPIAYVIVIDDNTAWMPLVFRGDVSKIHIGDSVVAEGVFVDAGRAIHADFVRLQSQETRWYDRLPIALPISVFALIVLGGLAIVVGISRRIKSHFLIPIILLFGLSACELNIDHIIFADGSVSSSTQLSESAENIEFFREIPGMRRYIAGWMNTLRDEGIFVENWVAQENEFFFLQQRYNSLESFSELDADEQHSSSWTYATSFQSGKNQCFRYMAVVDPQMLYTTSPDTDAAVIREMNKYLDQMDFTYRVTLPGQITYSNADDSSGNRLEWQVSTKRTIQIVAESCIYPPATEKPDWTWGWIGVGGLGLIDVGLWSFAFRKRRVKTDD